MNEPNKIIKGLKAEIKAQNISIYKLAAMTNLHEANLRRTLNLRQSPNLKTICVICNALKMSIEIKKA